MKSFSLLVILCGLLFQTTGAFAAPDGDENGDSREKLVFVYADTYPPLSQGGGTKVSGLLPDLVHQIVEERMGYKVRHWGEAWPRAQLAVEKGTAFAFITSLNPERLAFAHASLEPVLNLTVSFFYHAGVSGG